MADLSASQERVFFGLLFPTELFWTPVAHPRSRLSPITSILLTFWDDSCFSWQTELGEHSFPYLLVFEALIEGSYAAIDGVEDTEQDAL